MLDAIAPIQGRYLPIPVSPIRPDEIEHVELPTKDAGPAPIERIVPTVPVARERNRTLESQYRLTQITRRALLEEQEEHPLNGPHPTD